MAFVIGYAIVMALGKASRLFSHSIVQFEVVTALFTGSAGSATAVSVVLCITNLFSHLNGNFIGV